MHNSTELSIQAYEMLKRCHVYKDTSGYKLKWTLGGGGQGSTLRRVCWLSETKTLTKVKPIIKQMTKKILCQLRLVFSTEVRKTQLKITQSQKYVESGQWSEFQHTQVQELKGKLSYLSPSPLCFLQCGSLDLSDWRKILVAEHSNHRPSRSFQRRTLIGPVSVTCSHMSNHWDLKDRALRLARFWPHCGLVDQSTISSRPTRAT